MERAMRSAFKRRLLLTLLATAVSAACAETEPQGPYVGARQTLAYDSNLYRLPDHGRLGDQVVQSRSSGLMSTTLLLAGTRQQVGRQRLFADVEAGQLHVAAAGGWTQPMYRLLAGVDWETLHGLSGRVQLDAGRRLGGYGSRDLPRGIGRNDERYHRLDLSARLGEFGRSRLWIQADLMHEGLDNDLRFDAPQPQAPGLPGLPPQALERFGREERARAAGIGLRHRWSGSTIVGIGLRTESRKVDTSQQLVSVPSPRTTALDWRRNDLDLFVDHRVAELHELNARLSWGRTGFSTATASDSSDWSSSLRWTWRPTAKLQSRLHLWFDTGDRELGTRSASGGSGGQQTRAFEWQLEYSLTSKLNARAMASAFERKYGRDAGAFTDHDRALSLGLTWAVARQASLGCSIGWTQRTTTLQGEFGGDGFDATLYNCFAQLRVP
jgi:hypothetical protein